MRIAVGCYLIIIISLSLAGLWRGGPVLADRSETPTSVHEGCEFTLAGASCLAQDSAEDEPKQDEAIPLPDWWKKDDPLPVVKSNCVRCHIKSGRELTVPVQEFARSVHDTQELSCNDCHGGNTAVDAKAHEPEFDFIGTKLSTHIQACMDCHKFQSDDFSKSKHYWDVTKRINLDLPMCVDCHGNHDVGKPPAEFAMMNVCTDCHQDFKTKYPGDHRVITAHDAMWKSIRQVHSLTKKEVDPVPAEFHEELGEIRTETAKLVHRAKPVTMAQADGLKSRIDKFNDQLKKWVAEQARNGNNKE